MAFGIKNNFILKLIIFVASVIIMIGGYSFGSALYKGIFDITYHLILCSIKVLVYKMPRQVINTGMNLTDVIL